MQQTDNRLQQKNYEIEGSTPRYTQLLDCIGGERKLKNYNLFFT